MSGTHEKDRPGKKQFKFVVDQAQFESSQESLTGAQIKAIAHVDPSVQLFLEEPGPGSDLQINDETVVHLDAHGKTRLYTMPRANMGLV